MAVKLGYKLTKVGVIPEDWEIAPLSREIERLEAGTSVNSVDESLRTYSHEQSVLKTSAVSGGKFFSEECKKIAPRDLSRAHLSLRSDSILISRMNTPNLVGECGYVDADYPKMFLPDRLWMTKKRSGSQCNIRWLSYVLSSDFYANKLRELATGTSGSMKNIAKRSLMDLPIAFPSPLEQEAIAMVLGSIDTQLDTLDLLISKKHDLRRAAMQQVFTGKMRLPGFSDKWKNKSLSDFGSIYGGLVGKKKSDFGEGDGRYVTFVNVMTNVVINCDSFERVKVSPSESQNCVMKGDLLFNGSSETPEEVAMCSWVSADVQNLYLNSFCFGFRLHAHAEMDGLFLAYYLRSAVGRELMKSLAQGSTRYNLSKVALLESCIQTPCLTEQTAIRSVLSDMDAELAALQKRRDKTHELKQGMLQELLTGKTRLVV